MKRGLYQSKNGVIANADVNGAGNIMMKMFREAFKEPVACAEMLLRPTAIILK